MMVRLRIEFWCNIYFKEDGIIVVAGARCMKLVCCFVRI